MEDDCALHHSSSERTAVTPSGEGAEGRKGTKEEGQEAEGVEAEDTHFLDDDANLHDPFGASGPRRRRSG
jgi:hypothetical protein